MARKLRVQTPDGGTVTGYQVQDGSWQSHCDNCDYFAKDTREQVEAKGRQHLATRVTCSKPRG